MCVLSCFVTDTPSHLSAMVNACGGWQLKASRTPCFGAGSRPRLPLGVFNLEFRSELPARISGSVCCAAAAQAMGL